MLKGKFISSPYATAHSYGHPWHPKMIYNSYSIPLEPENGLLTVKKEFTFGKNKVESVILRATSLGIFEVYVNGESVQLNPFDFEYMKPGWTDYTQRVFEEEYDITALCKNKNTVVAEVAPGWWSGRISFGYYGCKKTAFCGEIEITYKDGSTEIIPTDETWDATVCGPTLYADIYNGEFIDARIPHASVKPNAHTWEKAEIFTDYTCKVVPFEGSRIIQKAHHDPISTVIHKGTKKNGTDFGEIKVIDKFVGPDCERTLSKGENMILDFGQNLVGAPIVFLKAKKGTRIDIYFAEMLNDSGLASRGNDGPKGSMYIKNYRSALARISYICGGGNDVEVIEAIHTFFGFRYMEIRVGGKTEIYGVSAEERGAEMPETGYFECDNPEVNKLFNNVIYGMKGNYFSVPTDCPQRDERLGWTGDTQIFAGAASYLCNTREFLHKWLGDARDSQIGQGGAYCDVIPRIFWNTNNGNAAWGDAGIIVPHILYNMYDDTDIVKEHYDSMEEYMGYIDKNFGLNGPDNASYGDWLNYEITDKHYVSVCYYAYDTEIMIEFAGALGKADRVSYYKELLEKIKKHWAEKYVNGDVLTVDTQTGYLLALAFDLCDGELRDKFIKRLEYKIISNGYKLSTGFVGTGVLNTTLSKVGLDKLAYSLLLQTENPSWLYPVRNGATTMWERWNSYTLKDGFGDVGMNSFNHYAYGAIAEWMFSGMCGICPSENRGFNNGVVLKPTPDFRKDNEIPEGQKRIDHAKAEYIPDCEVYAKSEWERVNGKMVYTFDFRCDGDGKISLLCDGNININGIDMTPSDLDAVINNGRYEFVLRPGKYIITANDNI